MKKSGIEFTHYVVSFFRQELPENEPLLPIHKIIRSNVDALPENHHILNQLELFFTYKILS